MAQHVEVEISIDGEVITPFAQITIFQDVHQHHEFVVEVPVDAFGDQSRSVLQSSREYIGKNIFIHFGPKLFQKKYPNNQFTGLVTHIGLSRSADAQRNIIIKGHSPTILMDGPKQDKSFLNVGLSDMAQACLENIPQSLETQIDPNKTDTLPYVVQYGESNWSFLKRMAARFGEWCFYNGEKFIYGKLPEEESFDLPFGEDLFSFEFSMELKSVNAKGVAYNYRKNEVFENSSKSSSVSDLDDYGNFVLKESQKVFGQEPKAYTVYDIEEQGDLEDCLTQFKSNISKNMVFAKGDSDNPYINVGSVINITGESVNEDDFGEFIITSLVHNISGNYSYHNEFVAIPVECQSPPYEEIVQPIAAVQPAVVVDNVDPEGLGRVKVRFYWQENADSTPWIRVASTMAGNGKETPHGFYFTPEIDDEVLIGFEDNNPDKPFVLSSIYHKNASPEEWKNNNNDTKVIRTRNGNEIFLTDKDGSEEIKILNKSTNDPTNFISLALEGDGKITIETKGELVMKAKSIEMSAEEGIKVSSGQATEMKSQSMQIEADQSLTTKSGSGTEIKAAEVKIDADSTYSLKSQQLNLEGAITDIKASGQLNVNGGGQATIKAGMIMLN